jgi:hypothetical protein
MSKFMVLYRSSSLTRERMENASPEQVEASLRAWRTWADRVSYALVDLGSPLAHTTHVGPGEASTDGVAGYSILVAGSAEEVETILDGHPHLEMPGASIEVLEIIPMGGQ